MKELEKIKQKVREWSGFELHGNNEQELLESLESIQNSLENEVFQISKGFRLDIQKLKTDEINN